MSSYIWVKNFHLLVIAISILLFVLRFFWKWNQSAIMQQRWVKIVPHIIDTLMLLSGTIVIVVHSLLCVSVILGRRNGTTKNGFSRMPFFPIPAVLCLAGMGTIFYLNLIDVDFGRPSLISTGEIILGASIYYFLFLSHRKNWNFHLPD